MSMCKYSKFSAIAGMLLCGLSMVASVATAQGQFKQLERIGIRAGEDGAQFIGTESGATFFVKGFNYIRLRGDHATFDADTKTTKAYYDPDRAEAMFSVLSRAGYNTVRVFIIGRSKTNPGIAGYYDTTKAIYEPYMENVLDFLRRATHYGIYVFPTFGDGGVPLNAYYRQRLRGKGHNKNVLVLTRDGIAVRVKHITSFLSYIKRKEPALLPTLLGLECQNEAYLLANQWPFTEKEGKFIAANGKTYDLSSSDERQALMDEGYRYYHKRVVKAVKAIDPDMLVAEGVFVPRAVGKDPIKHAGVWPGKTKDERYPPMLTAIGKGPLDFLDVHFYPTIRNESIDQTFRLNLKSTGFFTPEMKEIQKETPIIMGEFGAFKSVAKTFDQAVDNMARVRELAVEAGMKGMLYWTYDTFEQPRLYHAASDWPLFAGKMGNFEKNAKAADDNTASLTCDDVLSIRGGRFFLDGKPFAEISFNKFDLLWQLYDQLEKGHALTASNPLVKAQDKALRELHEMGFRTIRFFALPWGPRGPESYADPAKRKLLYAALDKALELCDRHDIRVVWSLAAGTFTDAKIVPGKGWVHGAEHKRELMTNPQSRGRKLLYRYIDEVVARYKNRKTVLMWEVGNETTLSADIGNKDRIYKGERMPTLKDVAGFLDDVARRIKAADPLRLVNSGGSHMRECQWNLYQRKGWKKDTLNEQFKCFELLYKDTAVDVIDVHSYMNDKPGYVISDGSGGHTFLGNRDWMAFSKRIGKPLMIGEIGLQVKPKTDKNIWKETPGYFESYTDVKAAKPWVEKTLNSVIDSGVQLSYWWCYQSDRPMDQKNPQRFDLTIGRNSEIVKCIAEANKRLQAKLGVN
ncbi:MAG: hypothetical protein DRP65_10180 [Planctomycetota bacterium]|nr:MAG: hypothetical protein DRP65_10180 [Planctomycetota bacterium]